MFLPPPKPLDEQTGTNNVTRCCEKQYYKQQLRIKLTLPDGNQKERVECFSTAYHIAMEICRGLAEKKLISSVNGVLWDMNRPLESGCEFKLLNFESDECRDTFCHSSAHILGESLKQEYVCKLFIGPCTTIGVGLYYDGFSGELDLNNQHFKQIELIAFKTVSGDAVIYVRTKFGWLSKAHKVFDKICRYEEIFKNHILGCSCVMFASPKTARFVLVTQAILPKPTYLKCKEQLIGPLVPHKFRGPIPESISVCQSSKTLSFGFNNLGGRLPINLKNLQYLKSVALETSMSFIDRLANEYAEYADIVQSVQVAVYETKLGLSFVLSDSLLKKSFNTIKEDKVDLVMESIYSFMKFPRRYPIKSAINYTSWPLMNLSLDIDSLTKSLSLDASLLDELLAVLTEGDAEKVPLLQFKAALQKNLLVRAKLMDNASFELLEVEFGNFLEAATIARSRGGVLLEAGVLGSCENYKDISRFLLFYVFANSLWSAESKGWPLKHFKLKEELLSRAKMFAKKASGQFYKFLCAEADNLSNEKLVLPAMKKQLDLSRSCKSLRGEFICARRILDHHLNWSPSRYVSEEYVVLDLTIYSADRISSNMVSVETLVFFWNLWKDMVVQILKYLQQLKIQDGDEYKRYGDLCLSYFGVWIKSENLVPGCFLLNPNAEWLKELDSSCFHTRGTLISINHSDFLSAARSYWTSELLSVGIKMLETLESIYNLSTNSVCSIFHKSNYLIHIFEAAKFLLKPEFLNGGLYTERLQGFVRIATKNIVDYIFPFNWYESLTEHVLRFGGTEGMQNLLEEVIIGILNSKDKMSYREIGKLVVVVLGAGKLNNGLYLRIAERLKLNEPWSAFIRNLCEGINLSKFYEPLRETSKANWRKADYMSPEFFLYLFERFVFLLFSTEGYLFFTKHSFIEWLTYRAENTRPMSGLMVENSRLIGEMFDFVATYIRRFLYNMDDTTQWIKNFHSNFENSHLLLSTRMVSLLCLLIFNSDRYFELVYELGNWPMLSFYSDIRDGVRKLSGLVGWSILSFGGDINAGQGKIPNANFNVFASCEAFQNIGSPIIMVGLGTNFVYPGVTYINMEVCRSKEEILKILFPKKIIQASQSDIDEPVNHSTSSSLVLRVNENRSQSGLQLNKDKGSQVPDEKACLMKCITCMFWTFNVSQKSEGILVFSAAQMWMSLVRELLQICSLHMLFLANFEVLNSRTNSVQPGKDDVGGRPLQNNI